MVSLSSRALLSGARTLRRHAAAASVCAASFLASGCSVLILNEDPVQCETTSDCAGLGAGFENTVCRENVCTVAEAVGGCVSNQECIDQASGNPAICRQFPEETAKRCVPLLSEDCIAVSGNVADDNAVVFGFMFPMKGDLAFLGDISRPFIELGISDFASNGSGIPGPNQTRRSLVMLGCDEIADHIRAGKHLVEQVGVPAIIGPGISEFAVPIMTETARKNKTFMILPFANSEISANLPDDGLLWHLRTTEKTQSKALASALPKLEAKIRAADETVTEIRVAVALKEDDQGQSFGQFLPDFLEFNGKSALDPANKANFKRVDFPACTDLAQLDQCFVDTVVALKQFRPHVVFAVGQLEIHTLLKLYEDTLQEAPDAPRPHWLFSDGAFAPEPLLPIIGDNDELRKRVAGAFDYTDFSTPRYAKFAQSFEGKFGVPPEPGFEALYDAFYMMAYGIAAAQNAPKLTGTEIATGVGRLLGPGAKVDVGFGGIGTALSSLGGGNSIDLDGLTGDLTCDPISGTCQRDWVLWCITRDGEGNPQFDLSGQYAVYNPASDTVTGQFACD